MGEDRSRFCKELVEGDISTEVADILGFDTRPRATAIINQLKVLRDRSSDGSISERELGDRTRASYLALTAYSREARGAGQLSSRDHVDNVTVEHLSTAFSRGQGLIFVGQSWRRPGEVFRGAPIFRDRRLFVSPEARDLWDVLRISEPSASDCLAVLEEIQGEEGAPDQYVLTDIYERLEMELRSGRRPRAMSKLPLWTGAQWQSARKIYAVAQEGLGRSLAKVLPVWQAPCALSALGQFIEAARIDALDATRFDPQGIGPGHRSAGSRLQPHFLSALREFAKLVSNQHPEVHRAAAVSFDELEHYELAHFLKARGAS
jgi:hypothetical protein